MMHFIVDSFPARGLMEGAKTMSLPMGDVRPGKLGRIQGTRHSQEGQIVAQYVRRYALLDPNRFGSITHDPVELACGDGQEGIAPGKQPQPWLRHPPVVLEDRQQLWREHRMPILLALPLFDADQHALSVDFKTLGVGT